MKSQKRERYYFDYNVYEKILKEKIMINSEFIDSNDIFISVAHIEEYYKAYKNDIKNENKSSLEKLKNIILNISKKGVILNPSQNSKIFVKSETFDECYDIIQKCNTREIVEDKGEKINQYQKREVENLRKNDKITQFNSTLNKKEIWERPEVKERISKFDNFYKNYNTFSFIELVPVYGVERTLKSLSDLPEEFKLYKGCFKNIQPDFKLLEIVIEYLHNLLGECGYHRDKEIRKTSSGIHDVSHSIYATYCNYFVTLDSNFGKRVEAIYYYLGIDTELLLFDELIKMGFV